MEGSIVHNMTTDACNLPDCNRPSRTRGLCATHYQRMRRAGRLDEWARSTASGSAEDRLRWHGWEVTDNGCWEWRGSRSTKGYGHVHNDGKMGIVPRIAYEVWIGPIPKGLHVLHRCNNPPCMNPDHLRAGTAQDNADDCALAGHSRGEHTHHKLDADKVRQIRTMREAGATYPQIASKFAVTRQAIGDIARGKTWTHVK